MNHLNLYLFEHIFATIENQPSSKDHAFIKDDCLFFV
jgi:hypothetical protein